MSIQQSDIASVIIMRCIHEVEVNVQKVDMQHEKYGCQKT